MLCATWVAPAGGDRRNLGHGKARFCVESGRNNSPSRDFAHGHREAEAVEY